MIDDSKTILCAAWPGSGKTYIQKKNKSTTIEIEYWKYKDGLQKEYIKDIKEHIGKVDYIFICTDPDGLKLLHKEGFNDIILVYPENESRNEYLDRYIERDSPPDFIGVFMKYWDSWIDELKQQTYCKHIILKSGQYLQDVL